MAAKAIDLDRRSDILELFPAEPLQPIALSQASSRLWSDEDLTGFGHICQTGHQVGNGTAGRERPPCSTHPFKTRRTDQGDPRVKAHVHGERLHGVFSVECLRGGEER